jgi:hypothetical protein
MRADHVAYTRTMARYRLRTTLRGILPRWAGRFVPKGSRDCGAHQWYHAGDGLDRCYHCEAGQRDHTAALGPSVGDVLRLRPWERRRLGQRFTTGHSRDPNGSG